MIYLPQLQQVFNCDEQEAQEAKEKVLPGQEPIEDRVTLLFWANATGDFEIKAWVTRKLFIDWLNTESGLTFCSESGSCSGCVVFQPSVCAAKQHKSSDGLALTFIANLWLQVQLEEQKADDFPSSGEDSPATI